MTENLTIYLGLDVGKTNHHATALTSNGKKIWDKPLPQSEPKIRELLTKLSTQGTVLLVVDQPKTIGALPIAIGTKHRYPSRLPARANHAKSS
ncbi:hypothetical protein GCM10009567_15670 [Rothia amarae]